MGYVKIILFTHFEAVFYYLISRVACPLPLQTGKNISKMVYSLMILYKFIHKNSLNDNV